MSEDFLGFVDPADAKAAQGPALIAGAKMGPREMALLHRLFKEGGGSTIAMVTIDEVTGVESWDMVRVADRFSSAMESQGEFWRRQLGWPPGVREPTQDEVGMFKMHRAAKTLAKHAAELAEAVRLDAAEGFQR